MKSFLIVFFTFYCFLAQAIVGGDQVDSGDIIEQSTVGLSNGCTGTLISKRHVLTAAHCIGGGAMSIVFGTSFQTGERVLVQDKIVHEGFNGFSGGGSSPDNPATRAINDIAILKMKEDAPAGYKPAELGFDIELVQGDKIILAGFGQTKPSGGGFGRLRWVETLFNFYNSDALEIVFGPTPGKSACRGDSGGPMYIEENGQLIVLGATSRGFGSLGPCSGNGNYSDVAAHQEWIEEALDAL